MQSENARRDAFAPNVVVGPLCGHEVVALDSEDLLGVLDIIDRALILPFGLRDDLERARVSAVVGVAVTVRIDVVLQFALLFKLVELQRTDGPLVVLEVDVRLGDRDVLDEEPEGLPKLFLRNLQRKEFEGPSVTIVHQWLMNNSANVFWSRIPMLTAMDRAMILALAEYSSQLPHI
tara:strand:- start:13 stop:543 length:531 start_codon:yes stop_codon:yes gene_type:complete